VPFLLIVFSDCWEYLCDIQDLQQALIVAQNLIRAGATHNSLNSFDGDLVGCFERMAPKIVTQPDCLSQKVCNALFASSHAHAQFENLLDLAAGYIQRLGTDVNKCVVSVEDKNGYSMLTTWIQRVHSLILWMFRRCVD